MIAEEYLSYYSRNNPSSLPPFSCLHSSADNLIGRRMGLFPNESSLLRLVIGLIIEASEELGDRQNPPPTRNQKQLSFFLSGNSNVDFQGSHS